MIRGVVGAGQRVRERRARRIELRVTHARGPAPELFLWSRAAIWAAAAFAFLWFEPNRHPRADVWDRPIMHELGFLTDVPAFGRTDFLSFGATYFNNQVRNLIVTQFVPVYTSVNIGSAHIQGVENQLSFRPARWLTITGAYTYTEAKNAADMTKLLRRPQQSASLNAVQGV